MLRSLLCCMVLILCFQSFAADGAYAIRSIPATLIKGANVIKRMEEIQFEIISTKEAVLHYKYAFTVLNENGDKYAGFTEWYDKFRSVVSLEGSLYDGEGKLVKRAKGKDFQDISGVDDISLMDDNRKKLHSFSYKNYPYTVEYDVVVKYNHTFHFPGWYAQEFQHLAVEQSGFTVITPVNYELRYRAYNYVAPPVQTVEKNRKTYRWEIKNIPALEKEYAAPRWHELTTMVVIAPAQFEIQSYTGSMNSWKEFGKFLYDLKKERDRLPEPVRQQVHQLTDNLPSEKEKISALYQFLQQNTRYIGIQLGIGGWQPFEAAYVAQKGYGDCKALTNYMYSLLKEAGIPSYYALIRAGKYERYLTEDFPSNQFNHAVLCVPLKKDTVWLECTSQSDPVGYMGASTGNRKALIIDENGGTLVATPRYGVNENVQVRTINGVITTEGDLETKIRTHYKGTQQDELHAMLTYLNKDRIKQVLNEALDFSAYDLIDFKYQQKKNVLPEIEEHLNLYVHQFITISGKRLFITPNLLNRSTLRLDTETPRKHDFVFEQEYRDIDSVELEIPSGYIPESLPQPVSLKTKFGSYSSQVQLNGNKLLYLRTHEQYAGRFPAAEAAALAQFYQTIYKTDRAKVVLVKKGE